MNAPTREELLDYAVRIRVAASKDPEFPRYAVLIADAIDNGTMPIPSPEMWRATLTMLQLCEELIIAKGLDGGKKS